MKTVNLQIPKIRLAGICGLFLAWTACSNEAVVDDPSGEGIPVTIRAEINTSGDETRADAATVDPANEYDRSSFVKGDVIRVARTVVNPDFKDYILGEDGKTWSVQGGTQLSLRIGANYGATYPSTYSSIASNQTTKDDYLASNLLKTPVGTSSSGELAFTGSNAFVHQNTKITLEFSGDGGNATLAMDKFSDFTISATGLRTGASATEQMTFYRPSNQAAIWHGIVYPNKNSTVQSSVNTVISLVLKYDNVKYSADINCPMIAGKHYNYSLKIRNDVLVPDGMTIDKWTDNDVRTGDFDPTTPSDI